MEVIIHIPKISHEKQNSFWYNGHIASLGLDNGHSLIFETSGCIEVNFAMDAPTFKDEDAVTEANNLGLVDTDLEQIIEDHDGFGNNNWFRIIQLDADGEVANDDFNDVAYDYDEAIELLKNYAEDINKKK